MRFSRPVPRHIDSALVELSGGRDVFGMAVGKDHGATGGSPLSVVVVGRVAVVAIAGTSDIDLSIEERKHLGAHDAGFGRKLDGGFGDGLAFGEDDIVLGRFAGDLGEEALGEPVGAAVGFPISVGAEDVDAGVGASIVEGRAEDVLVLQVGKEKNFNALVAGLAGGGDAVVGVKDRHHIIVIAKIELDANANLAGVGNAGRLLRRFLCLGENGEQNRGENRNDGDDDEQFDEGEASSQRSVGHNNGTSKFGLQAFHAIASSGLEFSEVPSTIPPPA